MPVVPAANLTPDPALRIRWWPGVLAGVLLPLLRIGLPAIAPDTAPYAFGGALLCALSIVVWWVVYSRAPRAERRLAGLLTIGALAVTSRLVHVSLAAGMGLLFLVNALPVLALAIVAWAVAARRLSSAARRLSLAATIVIACAVWTLVRTDGVTSGLIGSEFHWRWTPTAEERLLASAANEPLPPAPIATPPPVAPSPSAVSPGQPAPRSGESPGAPGGSAPAVPASVSPAPPEWTTGDLPHADWPGFRGADRDSIVRDVRIDTDWLQSPPVPIWRRAVGPGWSSFAVAGDVFYTQEQRGDEEVVAAYRVTTGEPVWRHRDAVRFWESNGGAGPRATPTVGGGRVYAFGATGILNALDARSGIVLWSQDVATDLGVEVPTWGFASSPIVVGEVVVVAAAGQLVAYDAITGARRWAGPAHGAGYSSPHRATIDGVTQILLVSDAGATSVAADGTLLWEHAWPAWPAFPVVQPAMMADGELLISVSGSSGVRRIGVARRANAWTTRERWTSAGLKPNFNDFVVHNGHAFGFDGTILACIDLTDGTRRWKGGRYGQGQLMLIRDQDLLLVVSDEGELALVSATTDRYNEVARFPAIAGKTWNHPVLVGDLLLVRNGEEMAAFRLPAERRSMP